MILEKLIKIPVLGKRIVRIIIRREGGEQISQLARIIARSKSVEVGLYSYGSCFAEGFNTGGSVIVGRYCSFGPNVHYFGANHPMQESVMSPYFYNRSFGFAVEDVKREQLVVGNDVWIGYGTIITSNCHKIGNGAVIGGGAVVTKDVPPYAVVVGNPGRIIRYRFKECTIESLEKSEWWTLTPSQLFDYYSLRKEPAAFAEAIINSRQE